MGQDGKDIKIDLSYIMRRVFPTMDDVLDNFVVFIALIISACMVIIPLGVGFLFWSFSLVGLRFVIGGLIIWTIASLFATKDKCK